MNSERSARWAGVFVVVAVLLLLAGFAYYLAHTAQRRGWRVPRCPYYTFVQSADGLEVGDPVKMMGFEVGAITTIEAQPPGAYYNVFVGIEIKRPYYGYIWTDSKMRVVNVGLLGRQLEVTKGVTGAPTVADRQEQPAEVWVDGKWVALAVAPKGVFLPPDESASVTERAEKLLGQVESALPNLLAVTNRLNLVLDNANGLLTSSTVLVGNVDRVVAQLPPVVSNVTVVTGHLTGPAAEVGMLLTNLNESLMNLASLTGNLNSQVQSNGQMLAGISALVTNADGLVQGLKKHWLLRSAFPATNSPAAKGK